MDYAVMKRTNWETWRYGLWSRLNSGKKQKQNRIMFISFSCVIIMFDEYTGWLLWWGWGSQFKILVFYLLMFLAFFVICWFVIILKILFIYLLIHALIACIHACLNYIFITRVLCQELVKLLILNFVKE